MLETGQETYDGLMTISIFWLCLCTWAATVKTHGIRQISLSKCMHCALPERTEILNTTPFTH